ncbi:MAG: Pyridoxal phosphate homeostasis protein [Legionella sp.]|uniref:YggS family pyridoxal phosphate-dependent enzyme n=1 Tax=Legionella sp. TaxID=459 RepID=UPI003D0DAFED
MTLQHNLNQIQQIIRQAALENGRNANEVLLLAVSKQQSAESIAQLFALGVCDFGENYFQEAQEKINALKDFPICWHFIGPIQSNKAKNIARDFNWVHSVNRLKIAQLLSEHRPSDLPPLNLCLQVNLIPEETKSGISPEEVTELALAVSQLPHLKLKGLMTIPPPEHDPQKQYELFMQMNQLLKFLNQQLGLNMDTLSMGMSDDLIPAIKAGATIVRIGRAIFGEREKK